MGSESYHEPYAELSPNTREMHRAIVSLMEELEAIDWYQQRADACGDEALKEILIHNKEEEIEHAAMALEWIRRHEPRFDEELRTYLFTEGPITKLEEIAMGRGEGSAQVTDHGADDGSRVQDGMVDDGTEQTEDAQGTDGSLFVRSLR